MQKNILKSQVVGLAPNSYLVKEYKKTLTKLSIVQFEAAIGLMLGDASLQTQNNGKTYRIKFEYGDKNKPYLDHIVNIFDEWILGKPHSKIRINHNNNLVKNWGIQTFSHEAFNVLCELFIINGKKGISENLIKNHLTGSGLAYWFMDDGGKLDYNKNSKNNSVVLNTQSFSKLEVENMAFEISSKFKLECSIRNNKGKQVIVISSSSYDSFFKIIEPYLINDMKYKLPNFNK